MTVPSYDVFELAMTERFLVHRYHDEAVVYDTWSGDTHQLGPVAANIASLLTCGGLSVDTLFSRIKKCWPADSSRELKETIEVTLEKLLRIGLIRIKEFENI